MNDGLHFSVCLEKEILSGSCSTHVEERDRLSIISKVVWALPGKRRQLLMMNRSEGLSYAEISRRVDLSETVVRKHIANALARCLQSLQTQDEQLE